MADRIWVYLAPRGPSARLFVACYMLVTGTARIITNSTPQIAVINVFSSRTYGVLLVLSGAFLLATMLSQYRLHWPGRTAAIIAAVLWILLAWQTRGAWVSFSGTLVFIAALINEVRANGN